MPPRVLSRYTFSSGIFDADDKLFLTDREPFRYQPFADNVLHLVREGDSLWTIAYRYYTAINRPSGLWWAVADFQPQPVFDPTIKLEPGSTVIVPSLRTLLDEILSESRREEAQT